ncbi:MAG: N-acetyltransferase [Bacteroidetes bacterium]|nr:MAG: N-acetyltransferase [Bacteroidota bacterium]
MKPFLQVEPGLALYLTHPRFAEALFQVVDAQREHLRRWLPWVDATRSPEDSRRFLYEAARFNKGGRRLTTLIVQNGYIIGSLGIVQYDGGNRWAELGYWIAAEKQGRGLMTRCCQTFIAYLFGQQDLNRLQMRIASENLPSKAVARKLGFQLEGTLRQALFLHNRFFDLEIYGLLRTEWKTPDAEPL